MFRSDDDLISDEGDASPVDRQDDQAGQDGQPTSMDGLPVADSSGVDSVEVTPEVAPELDRGVEAPESLPENITAEAVEAVEIETPEVESDEFAEVVEAVTRVETLSRAIERRPEAPVNYVLRGEALLDGGDYEAAASDFERALALANPSAETANWGYINRALADRAHEGLRRCRFR
jgi:tetratricopeptide (TPR) repeat protein